MAVVGNQGGSCRRVASELAPYDLISTHVVRAAACGRGGLSCQLCSANVVWKAIN